MRAFKVCLFRDCEWMCPADEIGYDMQEALIADHLTADHRTVIAELFHAIFGNGVIVAEYKELEMSDPPGRPGS
jgi:hypothetical protein